jgi:hypothetical protein
MNDARPRREAHPAVSAWNIVLAKFREENISDADPLGREACRQEKVKPLLRKLAADMPPIMADGWPQTRTGRFGVTNFVLAHCRFCGLCAGVIGTKAA